MIKQTTINKKIKTEKILKILLQIIQGLYLILISIMNKPEWQASEHMFHWLEENFHRGYIKSLY